MEDLYSVRSAVKKLRDRSSTLSEELSNSGRQLYDTVYMISVS